MAKDELKDWLFDILNENDSIFEDIALNEKMDILEVKTLSGQNYMIKVDSFEDVAKKNANEGYAVLSLSMSVLGLLDFGIIDNKNARRYLTKLSRRMEDVEI